VTSYSVSPALPAGLGLNTATGVVSGTPAGTAATATYTVTASNSAGNATVGLVITVNAAVIPPSGLAYSVNPAVYTAGVAIAANTPSSSGGAVTSYSVSPALPAGLGLNTTTGVVTGTPASATATATYTVTASNSAGNATVGLVITVSGGGGGSTPTFRLAAGTWEKYATANSMTTPAFSTQGAARTLVAVVSWYPPHTDPWPTTVAWSGGTPAGATSWTMAVSSDFPVFAHPEYEHWRTEIWTSTTTSILTNVQAVATRTNNDPRNPNDPSTGIFAVYEVTGARATLGGIWYVQNWVVTSAITLSVTPTASSSLIIGASQYGDFYALAAANASTVIDYQQTDGGSDGGAAAWHNANPTVAGTPVTLGVTLPGGTTKAFSACAVELLAP